MCSLLIVDVGLVVSSIPLHGWNNLLPIYLASASPPRWNYCNLKLPEEKALLLPDSSSQISWRILILCSSLWWMMMLSPSVWLKWNAWLFALDVSSLLSSVQAKGRSGLDVWHLFTSGLCHFPLGTVLFSSIEVRGLGCSCWGIPAVGCNLHFSLQSLREEDLITISHVNLPQLHHFKVNWFWVLS